LFSKYSTQDWEPIARLLRAGTSKIPDLTEAIEKAASTTRVKKKTAAPSKKLVVAKLKAAKGKTKSQRGKSKKTQKGKPKTLPKRRAKLTKSRREPPRNSMIETHYRPIDPHIEAWVRAVLAGSSLSELHEIYIKATGSKHLPVGRDALTRALVDFFQRGSPERQSLFMNLLQRRPYDETEEYRRWAEMISRFKSNR